jgi:hypothetical protein
VGLLSHIARLPTNNTAADARPKWNQFGLVVTTSVGPDGRLRAGHVSARLERFHFGRVAQRSLYSGRRRTVIDPEPVHQPRRLAACLLADISIL